MLIVVKVRTHVERLEAEARVEGLDAALRDDVLADAQQLIERERVAQVGALGRLEELLLHVGAADVPGRVGGRARDAGEEARGEVGHARGVVAQARERLREAGNRESAMCSAEAE